MYIFSVVSFESAEQDGEYYSPGARTCPLLPETCRWTVYFLFSTLRMMNIKTVTLVSKKPWKWGWQVFGVSAGSRGVWLPITPCFEHALLQTRSLRFLPCSGLFAGARSSEEEELTGGGVMPSEIKCSSLEAAVAKEMALRSGTAWGKCLFSDSSLHAIFQIRLVQMFWVLCN